MLKCGAPAYVLRSHGDCLSSDAITVTVLLIALGIMGAMLWRRMQAGVCIGTQGPPVAPRVGAHLPGTSHVMKAEHATSQPEGGCVEYSQCFYQTPVHSPSIPVFGLRACQHACLAF